MQVKILTRGGSLWDWSIDLVSASKCLLAGHQCEHPSHSLSNVFGSSEGLGGGAVSDMLWLRLIWGDVVEKEMAVVVGDFNLKMSVVKE